MAGPEWKSARAAGLLALALGACGGGGGGNGGSPPPPPPPPANQPPVFSSAGNVSVSENTAGSFYTISVADPEGGAVTLSVVPGGDEAAFNVNLAGASIAFAQPPDFEAPQDGNSDNVYQLTLEASDSAGLTARLTLTVTVSDVVEGMALRRVGSGFTQPLFVTGLPGTGQLIVLEKGGRARLLDPASGVTDPVDFLTLSGTIGTTGEGGLLGIAFSPAFASDRTFYVNVTNTAGDTEIRRYQTFPGTPDQGDPSTEDRILFMDQPDSNHNGGWLDFGPDGLLYIPTGDGGGGGDPRDWAQDPDTLFGKLLRIDPSADDFPADPDRDYAIPADNVYPGGAGGRPEIYATGLRNPFRCSFDSVTGDLFIGDVGQGAVEEIDRIGTDEPGVNFGWDLQEGTQSYAGGIDMASFRDPVAEYGHGSGPMQGNSVTGGYVHRGNVDPIRDQYVFGDFVSGNIWSLPASSLVNGSTVPSSAFVRLNDSLVPDAGALGNISSFGEDEAGNLYIVSYSSGDIFQVVSTP
ncbi:MAG: PQQ-dependent sugar dehydrogenase [Hyphomonas sp.]|nr:PQQ-dependent sugar dehydrogenase [Hyphomonas sp.]